MVNEEFKKNILNALGDRTGYNFGDFIYDEKDKDGSYGEVYTEITITYKYDERYKFELLIPSKRNRDSKFNFDINMSPGEILMNERSNEDSISGVFDKIRLWIERINKAVINGRENKAFAISLEEHERRMGDLVEKVEEMEGDYFTREEAGKLVDKLNEMEDRFNERYSVNNEENKRTLDNLKKEIDILRNTVEQMNKKNWALMFLSKLCVWIRDPKNKATITAAKEVAKMALPESARDVINNVVE